MTDPNEFFTRSILGATLRLDIAGPATATLAEQAAREQAAPVATAVAPGAFAPSNPGLVPIAIVNSISPQRTLVSTDLAIAAGRPANFVANAAVPAKRGHAAPKTKKLGPKQTNAIAGLSDYAAYDTDESSNVSLPETNLVASPAFMISIYALIVITVGLALYVLGQGALF